MLERGVAARGIVFIKRGTLLVLFMLVVLEYTRLVFRGGGVDVDGPQVALGRDVDVGGSVADRFALLSLDGVKSIFGGLKFQLGLGEEFVDASGHRSAFFSGLRGVFACLRDLAVCAFTGGAERFQRLDVGLELCGLGVEFVGGGAVLQGGVVDFLGSGLGFCILILGIFVDGGGGFLEFVDFFLDGVGVLLGGGADAIDGGAGVVELDLDCTCSIVGGVSAGGFSNDRGVAALLLGGFGGERLGAAERLGDGKKKIQ